MRTKVVRPPAHDQAVVLATRYTNARDKDGVECLPCQCWCMRKVMLVPIELVRRGRTLACDDNCG